MTRTAPREPSRPFCESTRRMKYSTTRTAGSCSMCYVNSSRDVLPHCRRRLQPARPRSGRFGILPTPDGSPSAPYIHVAGLSISGIRVRIDQSWFIAFFLFTWILAASYLPMQAPNYSILAYWIFGTVCALGLFASVLIHELSHCLVARKLGVPV